MGLGQRRCWRGVEPKRKCVMKSDEMMYIPVLETIQRLLNSNNIMMEVITLWLKIVLASCYFQIEKGHGAANGDIRDFCDGEVYKSHPLFSLHPTALQIFFYFDDVEVCNPLGSKTKTHKLSNLLCMCFLYWQRT